MQLLKGKYFFLLFFSMCLIACTKTEKWGYVVDHEAFMPKPGFGGYGETAYKEYLTLEVQYKNNLVSLKESYKQTPYKMIWGSGMTDSVYEEKITEAIIGPCPFVDEKNWKCGKYQMFSGELKDERGKLFRE
jgi:hypothetical protein